MKTGSDPGKPLFTVLDIWASHFISPQGKALILLGMIPALDKALAALPDKLKQSQEYVELEDYFCDLKQKYDEFELEKDHPFNTVMYEFLKHHEDVLSELGRQILANVQKLLGNSDQSSQLP